MKIHQFPLPIYGIIRDYLIDYEDRAYMEFSLSLYEIRNWTSFVNSSKMFAEIKREFGYYFLSGSLAEEYVLSLTNQISPDFELYKQINETVKNIKNPFEQIHLSCHVSDYDLVMPSSLDVKCFRYTSEFRCRALQDISFLKNVMYVSIRYCFTRTDLSPLRNCISVDLSGNGDFVNDANVHYLTNVRYVYLDYCYELSDISCLANVFKLSLKGCVRVKDVSMLGRVHCLNISYCDKVEDISALNQVCCLNVSHNRKIKKGLRAQSCGIKDLIYCPGSRLAVSSVKDLPSLIPLCLSDCECNDEAINHSR
jgi:hypothetical protein